MNRKPLFYATKNNNSKMVKVFKIKEFKQKLKNRCFFIMKQYLGPLRVAIMEK